MSRISGQDEVRAERVRFQGTVLALVQLENGRSVRARVHQLSANGGILQLPAALDEELNVLLLFHIGSTTVRGQARMQFPLWSTRGCLQPFRFTGLGEEARDRLQDYLQSLLGQRSTDDFLEQDPEEEI
jgi:hypothetical protein